MTYDDVDSLESTFTKLRSDGYNDLEDEGKVTYLTSLGIDPDWFRTRCLEYRRLVIYGRQLAHLVVLGITFQGSQDLVALYAARWYSEALKVRLDAQAAQIARGDLLPPAIWFETMGYTDTQSRRMAGEMITARAVK